MSDTILMGLGNILLGDEGVGVHVVNAIRERFDFEPAIDVVDGGTLGLNLLPYFEDHDRVLLVDAVDFGKEPGHIAVLRNDELPDAILQKFSVHHIGLNDILGVARLLGKLPTDLRLIGIQPASMEASLEPTPTVMTRFEEAVSLALEHLGEWGISHRPRMAADRT